MDEVLPSLWIGDLPSALDTDTLKEKNICSVVSAMRGRVTLHDAFNKHQINIDDDDDEDVLVHFLPAIAFIQTELDNGRGVLVHCQAGMSRSATIVAAYIMYSRHIDCEAALEIIRKARPSIEPNAGFVQQLEVFHQAAYEISHHDKTTRMFYLERTVEEVMNGDGSSPASDMFAKFPRTPNDSQPPTPGASRRRIRCKMCRQELAAREHMLDHGQLGPPTPAVAFTPAASRRPSMNGPQRPKSRQPSINLTVSRRPSIGQLRPRANSRGDNGPSYFTNLGRGLSDQLSMSALDTGDDDQNTGSTSRRPSGGQAARSSFSSYGENGPLSVADLGRGLSDSLSMSALETDDNDQTTISNNPRQHSAGQPRPRVNSRGDSHPLALTGFGRGLSNSLSMSALDTDDDDDHHVDGVHLQTRSRTSSMGDNRPTKPSPLYENSDPVPDNETESIEVSRPPAPLVPSVPTTTLHPSTTSPNPPDLVAQLNSHPKLAAGHRSPRLTSQMQAIMSPISPPILINPKCSGYFVEPMKWMEPFLQEGQLAGKIVCPNKKCGAKLGNYDWAGVCCGCREWVIPGFCINRSKVDEVV